MKERSLKFLAKIFAYSWQHSHRLQKHLFAKSYGHLWRRDGIGPYMLRYRVVDVGTWQSFVLKALTLGAYDHVRLHVIMQPDADRELHNHPFNYRTFILDGWYREQRIEGVRNVLAGQTVTGEGYHRIAMVPPDGVTTLFMMGKDRGEWGFLVGDKHVTSREFFANKRGKNGTV